MNNGSVVGGLVGQSGVVSDGQLVRSHADIAIQAPVAVAAGGLVGASSFHTLLSYATGSVQVGDNGSAGGLIGKIGTAQVSVLQSYSTGNIKGGANSDIGGLVGSVQGNSQIGNSYSTGAVRGGSTAIVGGFVGEAGDSDIETSYSMGYVAGKESGGFLGDAVGETIFWNYWDTDTSGKPRRKGCDDGHCPHGIKGLTTEEFQSGLPQGFDPSIWAEKKSINGGFPYLFANPPPH